MANWFCCVFNVVCRKRLFSLRCRSELIGSTWVVIVPGQKCINNKTKKRRETCVYFHLIGKSCFLDCNYLIMDISAAIEIPIVENYKLSIYKEI